MSDKNKAFNPLDTVRPIHLKDNANKKKLRLGKKAKLAIGISTCVVLLVLTFILGQRIEPIHTVTGYITMPVQRACHAVSDWFGSLSEKTKSKQALIDENEALKEQVANLQYQVTGLQNDLSYMQELKDLWDLASTYEKYEQMAVQVVGRSANNWYSSIIVDKGDNDGLKPYMPVLSGAGLLGHVKTVYKNYAMVETIVDPSTSIYAEVNRVGKNYAIQLRSAALLTAVPDGIDADKYCYIDFDYSKTDIMLGDEIVTSAIGEIYPPALLIGYVETIVSMEDGRNARAFVKPVADIESAGYVLIITDLWKADMAEDVGDLP